MAQNSVRKRPAGMARRGDALYILLAVVTVLFILAMSILWIYRQQVSELTRYTAKLQAYQLALSGLDRAQSLVRQTMDASLVRTTGEGEREEMEINADLLELLDPERAKEWARVFNFADGEILSGGTVKVTAELVNVTKNEFFTYIDRVEKIPPGLEVYREKRDEEDNPITGAQPLGGWTGQLRLTSQSTYHGQRVVVQEIKAVKMLDISPPAPDHSLFIHGKATEFLKEGTFTLSNLVLPDSVLALIHELTLTINQFLHIPEFSPLQADVLKNVELINNRLTVTNSMQEMGEALKLVFDISQATSDEKIKDMVDNIILSLNPRDWGRVRTNGVLQIYVPFFAPDDIINYFADTSVFGHMRPEIGYHNCYNRLHDPYLSVYTHYEGYIYKNYRRLDPLLMGPTSAPQVIPPQRYTINTRMNYVLRYPNREEVPNLQRLEKNSRKYATMVYKTPASFFGTRENPIVLDGIWHCQDDVRIGGYYIGRGLIVSEKTIEIDDHIRRLRDQDALGLVSLGSTIDLKPSFGDWIVQADLYAKDGLKGTKNNGIILTGNLACETLNRAQMPKAFQCRFDPRYKNHMADNIRGTISTRPLMFRVLSDATTVKPARASL